MPIPPLKNGGTATNGAMHFQSKSFDLRGLTDDVVLVGEAGSGMEAVAIIEREKPDIALLDWQMPELDGIGVVRMLKKDAMPLIAFVTAYDEYAVKAFEVNAVDYLLKPVDKARLRQTLNRAQELVEHAEMVAEQAAHDVAAFLDALESAGLIASIPEAGSDR